MEECVIALRCAIADVHRDVGDSSLYFGCRNEAGDFLYRDEWQALKSGGALGSVVTAFSRDQECKVYVTHRLREHGNQVWQLLQQARSSTWLQRAYA